MKKRNRLRNTVLGSLVWRRRNDVAFLRL